MPDLTALVLLVVTLPLAVGLHELTHYAVAKALGIRCWVASPTCVAYVVVGDRPRWQYRLVGLAPQLVGGFVGGVWVLTHGIPWSPTGIVAMGSWAIYSVGSVEDISLAAAKGRTPAHRRWWRGLGDDEQFVTALAVGGGAAGLVATAGVVLPVPAATGLVGLAAWATFTAGSWSDVSLAAAHGKEPWPARRWRQLDNDERAVCRLLSGGVVAATAAIVGGAVPIFRPVSVGLLFGVAALSAIYR